MTGSLVYGSICSGIEAATTAWHSLRWKPAFFSEIDNFPRAVLQHHYPSVTLHGDFTRITEDDHAPGSIDLLVGGTPCQAFSVAGLRKGFADERGNLTLEFVRMAQRLHPRWLVWENVPGVLSIDGGRAFGSFLGGLAKCGYGFAYRILDAQHFGVPQRRRRVFVVGYFGDWRPAAAVLFERESLLRDITPSRKAGQNVAGTFKSCSDSGGWSNSADHAAAGYMVPVAPTISARTNGGGGLGTDFECDGGLIASNAEGSTGLPFLTASNLGKTVNNQTPLLAHALTRRYDSSEDGCGRGTPLVPVPYVDVLPTMRAGASQNGPGHAARSGDTKDEYIVPMTLAIRGRESESRLEIRQDGLANAILTPNGGRSGIGIGAVAYRTNAAGQVDPQGSLAAAVTTMTDPATQFLTIPINMQAAIKNGEKSPNMLGIGNDGDPFPTLGANDIHAVAFAQNTRDELREMPVVGSLAAQPGMKQTSYIRQAMQVRRITPREAERLQGFPDDYTLIPYRGKLAADGNRYKALGNSMAVPVMRWLGERIQMVNDLQMEMAA